MSKLKIYIAGPYTVGDVAKNVATAIGVANVIMDFGLVPFCPHLTHFWHCLTPYEHTYEEWLEYDLEWLTVCDVLVRIDGESAGADREVRYAQDHGIKVFQYNGDFINFLADNYVRPAERRKYDEIIGYQELV